MNSPNLRDIFDSLELIDETTSEYEKLHEKLKVKLKERFPTFKEYDEIENLLLNIAYESQATGFEQGYKYAMGLIRGGTDDERTE